ncbi:type IV toxin-antitoxin system AbiEi family antitoxin domain-containing protein [Arhodomonas sp. SL1]|uniref:type IV toxin-antitoxin system AbiEi family antitoxin domain-containing protein n=1 Tax=Arhodomonas sp. SL1 TaxID=3425691 RepID=UPI003F885E78
MTEHSEGKLNRLQRQLPEGLLVDARWLEANGYSRSLRSQYVTGGWLEQPARAVYRRPRGELAWEQVVISLQAMLDLPVSVGGRTALGLQGYAHYLPQSQQHIHLYSTNKLPGWLNQLPLQARFVTHNRTRFLPDTGLTGSGVSLSATRENAPELPGALRVTQWGEWKWPLVISAAERAILELLDELPSRETFHDVDMIMEGLVNLSPRRLQPLLEDAKSVKVKRLFFFYADRYRHRWAAHLDRDRITLGKGKRVLVKGGRLDPEYNITVPEDMDGLRR